MSQQDLERVKLGTDAISRRDIEALLETFDPGAEWTPAFPAVLDPDEALEAAGRRE